MAVNCNLSINLSGSSPFKNIGRIRVCNDIDQVPPLTNSKLGQSIKSTMKDEPTVLITASKAITSGGLEFNFLAVEEKSERLGKIRVEKVIGKGSFGFVLLGSTGLTFGHQNSHDHLVAIKVLSKADVNRMKIQDRVTTEFACLSLLSALAKQSNRWFPKLHGAFQTSRDFLLVQEFIPGGELYYHLEMHKSLPGNKAKTIIAESLVALGILHANGIIFRDFKPENIMFDSAGHVKLVDFGLSFYCKQKVFDASSGAKSFVGTTEYLSPEMILKRGHGYAVDFWSLGMVLYEMLTGLPPWYSRNVEQMTSNILQQNVPFYSKCKLTNMVQPLFDLKTTEILTGLLDKNARTRLGSQTGVAEIMENLYFCGDASFSWEQVIGAENKPGLALKQDSSGDGKERKLLNILQHFDHNLIEENVPRDILAVGDFISTTDIHMFNEFQAISPRDLLFI